MILPWLGKSSGKKSSSGSKSKNKKSCRESSFFDAFHLRRSSKGGNSSTSKEDSDVDSALPSASTSTSVTRCQSFSYPVPLPLPGGMAPGMGRCDSGISVSQPQSVKDRSGRLATFLPLPSPEQVMNRLEIADGAASGSECSTSSVGSDDPSDRDLLNHTSIIYAGLTADHGKKYKKNKKSKEQPKSKVTLLSKQQNVPLPPTKGFSSNRDSVPKKLQIPVNRVLVNATDSSAVSSPSSPMRAFASEHHSPSGGGGGAGKFYPDAGIFGSGNCSSPGSGQNSGQNSMGGDIVIGQHNWQQQQGKGSSERSPVLSPKMRSPGPSSRGQSVAVSPLHPRAGGLGPESPTGRHEEGKQPAYHPLPRPPRSPTNSSPYSPSAISSGTRSPGGKDNPTSPATRWKKGKLLGSGTFGHVYVGFNSENGEMCAMKEVTLFSDDSKSKDSVKQLGQEIAVLSHLRHPNIVQYYGSETVDDTLYIYLEYVSGGSIHQLLREYGQFGEPAIRSYTRQILAGLAYLHDLNTVHRDIKGANILVDPNGQVKLADFGMAKHITAQSFPLSFRGTPHWMAPEVIKNLNGYDLVVDIWSLGCTVVEMATAEPPWRQYEGVAAMFKIGNSKELPAIPDHLSEEGKNFVRLCLQRNPSNRPTAAKLLEHPFVKNAAPFVKLDRGTKALETEALPSSANGSKALNSTQHPAHSRHPSSVEVDHSTPPSRVQSPYQPSSDQFYVQRNISGPVSPSASPMIQPRSPHYRYDGMSPSPISTPILRSGSSTPLTGGYGAIPLQGNGAARQSAHAHDFFGNMPQMMNGPHSTCFCGYADSRPDIYWGMQAVPTPEGSPRPQSHLFAESDVPGKAYSRVMRNENGHGQSQYGGHGVLAENEPQKLLKTPQLIGFDLRPVSPILGRANGHEHCLKVVLQPNWST